MDDEGYRMISSTEVIVGRKKRRVGRRENCDGSVRLPVKLQVV